MSRRRETSTFRPIPMLFSQRGFGYLKSMALEKVRCPVCRSETSWEGNRWRPFCSERCKLLDLGNWVTERYRIPDAEPPPKADANGEEDDD